MKPPATVTPARLAWGLKDLAAALGISVSLLRLEVARGKLRVSQLGGRTVVPDEEAQRYLMAGMR